MMTAIFAATAIGVSGAYFESRTCSIYAGPCHYSGEAMVDGRTGAFAWSFDRGRFHGVELTGIKAAAVVRSDDNLDFGKPRRSVIYLDARATRPQRAALLRLLKSASGIVFGEIVAVKDTAISLSTKGADAALAVTTPDGRPLFEARTSGRQCLACPMPGVLWYEPMTRGADVEIATVEIQRLSDPTLGETWTRREEPASFVGRFSW